MTTLIPLFSLADPTAFLQGARVPLVQPSDPSKRWECINGTLYEQMGCSFEAAVEYDEAADQDAPSRAAIRVLALDPSDPDVARHCDRRIAEALSIKEAKPWAFQSSSLIVIDGHVALAVAFDIHIRLWSPAQIHGAAAGVWPADCIPTARAALVLALYGRTP